MAGKRGYGAGSVSKSSDPKRAKKPWIAQVYRGVSAEGKAQFQRSYHATQREAERACRGLAEAQEKGELVAPDKRTVGEWMKTWLEDIKKSSIRRSSYEAYHVAIYCHLCPRLGHIALQKLVAPDIQSFIATELASGAAPNSVNIAVMVLKSALKLAVEWGMLARNVADLVKRPRCPRVEKEPLTPEEARTFLGSIRGDRLEALYITVVALGMRKCEAIGLRWQDIDLDRGELRIVQQLVRVAGGHEFSEPKTTNGRRTLSLPTSVVKTLRAHRQQQLRERLVAGPNWQENGLVFTTPVGRPVCDSWITVRFQRLLELAGLPRKRFHDTRHTAASLLIAMGCHPREIMGILGHANIGITMNLYGHLFPASFTTAASRMDRFLTDGEVAAG